MTLLVAVWGLMLLSYDASALAASGAGLPEPSPVDTPRPREAPKPEGLGSAVPSPQQRELSTIEASERMDLAEANQRHGMPAGVPVPEWALQPGQHPYFAPSPKVLGKEALAFSGTIGFDQSEAFSLEESGAPRAPAPGGILMPQPGSEKEANNFLGLRYEGEVPPIRYHSGVVQHEPKIDVVFWGSRWSEPPGSELRTMLLEYYKGLSGSAEQGVLTQYFDASGYISSTLPAISSTVDTRAATNVNAKSVEAEVKYAESVMGTHNSETQYEVITGPGSTYEASFAEGYCAFHDHDSEGAIYAFVPYAGDEPFNNASRCTPYYGNGNASDATNVMASHEYAEIVTDPLWDTSPGWRNNATSQGEIADLCATPGDKLGNSWVQGWYDDHQNACSESDGSPPHIMGLTETATIYNITKKAATLNATVNPENAPTTYQFNYGPTTSYGSVVPAKEESAGSTQANVPVSGQITGLEVEKPYHFRVVAKNGGITDGEDRTVIPSKWSLQAAPTESSWSEDWLNAASCGSIDSCMVVGYYYQKGLSPEPNQALSYQLVEGRWLQKIVPLNAGESYPELIGVTCTSRNACVGVGEVTVSKARTPLIARWNGTSWSREAISLPGGMVAGELRGVSCMVETECMAVGTAKTSAGVWVTFSALWSNGSWTSFETPSPGEAIESVITGVACGSTKSCMAVGWYNPSGGGGAKPFSLLLEGGRWSYESRTTEGFLEGVTCTSAQFCVGVGTHYGAGPSTETWNGSVWTAPSTPEMPDIEGGYFTGISCLSTTRCTTVGAGYSKTTGGKTAVTMAATWDGTSWKEQATPRESEIAPNWLSGVSCVGPEGCVTVGYTKASDNWASALETRAEATPVSHLLSFGSFGSAGGQLKYPAGVTTDASGNVWVADEENNRIAEFTSKGTFVQVFGWEVNKTKVEHGGSEAEKNLCTAASGNVCQAGKAGNGNDQLHWPLGIAFTSAGNLWVTDGGNDRVEEFNTKGEYLTKFGSEGSEGGHFYEPDGIAIATNGDIWVSDTRYYRVEEFTPTGEFIRQEHGNGWGGSGNGEFSLPKGVAIDSHGNVWVVDCGNHRVQEITSAGEYISEFGLAGIGEGQFGQPRSIAIKASGNLLIGDREPERVQEFTPSGEYLSQSAMEGEAQGIALGAGGVEYVTGSEYGHVEKWEGPTMPEGETGTATAVKANEATLKGTVNPSGAATTYTFEYGTTISYGNSVPAPSESAGSGTEAVPENHVITGLQPETTYHFRIVASNTYGTIVGKDETFRTERTPDELAGMAVTDQFNGNTSAISNFNSNWYLLGWASEKGLDRSTGWNPSAAYPTVAGAYYGPTITDVGTGIADVVTMAEGPSLEGRYFSLWLDMSSPSSTRSGYELTFTDTSSGIYEVKLSKWVSGAQTVLALKSNYAFSTGDTIALVDHGSTVSAWINTGSGFSQLLSATDATFEGGESGIEGAGNFTRLTNFKVGQLLEPVANTNAALQALALNDSFSTNENPLSDSGAFAALSWDNSGSGHNTGWVENGWGPYDAYSTINGAYWQKTSFADTGAGDAVAAKLSKNPEIESRYFALWLNMPNPASARSGYELRFKETGVGVYEVIVARWQSGTESILAAKPNYAFTAGSLFALDDNGGTVSAWTKTGSEYVQLLSASDPTYTSGYTGIEGSGNIARLKEFRSGPLPPI